MKQLYIIAPNGIKIDARCAFSLLSNKVNVTVKEPRLNVALTEELKSKGSVKVTFNYGEFKEE